MLASEIIDGAQQLSDKVNDPSVDPATWLTWLNRAIERLWRIVATAFGDQFFVVLNFTVTNGTDGISIAADVRRVRGLEKDPGLTNRRWIRRFAFAEKDSLGELRYRFMGDDGSAVASGSQKIYIEPFERNGGNYRLYYVPAPGTAANAGASIPQWAVRWSEALETLMALKALGKEESDTGDLAQRWRDIKDEIVADASATDIAEPDSVTDVESVGMGRVWYGRS